MPTMASITVKKADGTTDIIYDAISPAPGDGSPAFWRQDTGAAAGLPVGLRPTLEVWSKWNGPRTARQVMYRFRYPYAVQNSTTTLYSANDTVVFSNDKLTVPQGIPAASLNEAGAQFSNLMASALLKSVNQQGYAPS